MENEKRLIDANAAVELLRSLGSRDYRREKGTIADAMKMLSNPAYTPTVDAYSEEQVANLIQQTEKLEAKNKELEKEVSWLKSCLNCKIRKECPRHCGKVVHDCDHWEYGDSTVDAVPVVHGRWEQVQRWATKAKYRCSVCGREIMSAVKVNIEKYPYCHCGAKMDEKE